ncbi:UDP-glycosyltransferase UGT4-like [Haematobia irritans]|uniref:UDP-glycosyltransferase UGT4-like n=1 Tax=Haematobia irritans TaxID=7368 RepID=UPI003F50BCC9
MRNLILKSIKWMVFILAMTSGTAETSNILAFLPTCSSSHLIIDMAVVKAMAERGHNVTVVSVLPLKSEWLHPSMIHIHLDRGSFDLNPYMNGMSTKSLTQRFKTLITMFKDLIIQVAEYFEDPKLKELQRNSENHFDLMIFGYFAGDYAFGLAEHFNCPIALIWPNIPTACIIASIGNPLEISYTPSSIFNLSADIKGLAGRFMNMIYAIFDIATAKLRDYYGKPFYE